MSTANKLAQKLRHHRTLKVTGPAPRAGIDRHAKPSVASVARAIYLRPLQWKIAVISLITLFLSSNVLAGFNAEGGEGDSLSFLGEETMETPLIASGQDGFLIKPSLQTSDGVRTGVNDILKYNVRPGDTVSYIAARFGVSPQTVLDANGLGNRGTIRTGQELLILPVDGLLYKVQQEDTLEKIAKKFQIEQKTIIAQNNLKDGTVASGKDLILPGAKKIVVPPPVIAKATPKKAPARYASLNFNPSDPEKKEAPAEDDSNEGFSGTLLWPVAGGGKTSQRFSYRHPAYDITYGSDTLHPNILAAEDGKVVEAYNDGGWHGGYGNVIVIDHGDGVKTRYAHNDTVYVSVGDTVSRGEKIAKMGNTGRVYGKTGIHVHFEVIVKGKRVNPGLYF